MTESVVCPGCGWQMQRPESAAGELTCTWCGARIESTATASPLARPRRQRAGAISVAAPVTDPATATTPATQTPTPAPILIVDSNHIPATPVSFPFPPEPTSAPSATVSGPSANGHPPSLHLERVSQAHARTREQLLTAPPPAELEPLDPDQPEPCESEDFGRSSRRQRVSVDAPGRVRWEEDDGTTYAVPEDPKTKSCLDCGKASPLDAKLCVHCGHYFQTGEKAKRSHQPLRLVWHNGLPPIARFGLFALCQVGILGMIGLVWLGNSEPISVALMWLILTGVTATLLGTFDRLELSRNRRGRVRLTKIWYVCFIQTQPRPINWRQYESVAVATEHEVLMSNWLILGLLLTQGGLAGNVWVWLIVGALPAGLFWWLVIRPVRSYAALCRDHHRPVEYLYRGSSDTQAAEIGQAVRDVCGLLDANQPPPGAPGVPLPGGIGRPGSK